VKDPGRESKRETLRLKGWPRPGNMVPSKTGRDVDFFQGEWEAFKGSGITFAIL
jgi:hypothetical protein